MEIYEIPYQHTYIFRHTRTSAPLLTQTLIVFPMMSTFRAPLAEYPIYRHRKEDVISHITLTHPQVRRNAKRRKWFSAREDSLLWEGITRRHLFINIGKYIILIVFCCIFVGRRKKMFHFFRSPSLIWLMNHKF